MRKLTFEKTEGAFTKAKIYHYYNLPIKITNQQNKVVTVVDKILRSREKNPTYNISDLEIKLDKIVYHLYSLTYDEVLIIDPKTPITREEYETMDN